MKLQNIIKEASISQKENEGAFFASVALTILEQFENFSLLDSAESIKKNLQELLEDSHSKNGKLFQKNHSSTLSPEVHFCRKYILDKCDLFAL